MPQLDLSPWRRSRLREKAKQGLATDIVFGDSHISKEHGQYQSTMKKDYVTKQLNTEPDVEQPELVGDADKREKVEWVSGLLGIPVPPRYNAKKVNLRATEENEASTKSHGSVASGREVHVVFGDKNHVGVSDRMKSVTSEAYSTPNTVDSVSVKALYAIIKILLFEGEEPYVEMPEWQKHKGPVMSAAHSGLTTRLDLPTDARFFNNFATTSQDAYTTPIGTKEVDETSINIRKNTRKGNIHFGDRNIDRSYESVAKASFAGHEKQCYTRDKQLTRAEPIPVKALLGHSGENSKFQSTSQTTYTKMHVEKESTHTLLGQHRGKSSIAFGERMDSEHGTPNYLSTGPSVTQRDFKPHENIRKPDTDSFRRISPGVIHGVHPGCAPDVLISCNTECYADPTGGSHVSASMHQERREEAAKLQMHSTSIPLGAKINGSITNFVTTTKGSYQSHVGVAEIPEFPVRGANITKSSVALNGIDAVDGTPSTTIRSTASEAFVDHYLQSKTCKRESFRPRGRTQIIGFDGMNEFSTTSKLFFQAPTDFEQTMAIAPTNVERTLLFPVKREKQHNYETTMERFFGSKPGLYEVKAPKFRDQKRGASSIVFGDPTHFIQGNPVYNV